MADLRRPLRHALQLGQHPRRRPLLVALEHGGGIRRVHLQAHHEACVTAPGDDVREPLGGGGQGRGREVAGDAVVLGGAGQRREAVVGDRISHTQSGTTSKR